MPRSSEQLAQLAKITEGIITKHPQSAESLRFLSTVLREAGKPAEALGPAITAVELDMGDSANHNELLETLRGAREDIEMMTELINSELPDQDDDEEEEGSK